MLLLQKQLIDQINNSLVDKKNDNGLYLPYSAVYGTPTKITVDHFQWCVEDTTPIDIINWSWFLKIRVADIDETIPMQLPDIHTRICNLDIHRVYLLYDIPIDLDKVGLLRAEFSLRFGFSDGLYVPLNLYLSLYDVDCPENCWQDSESIALIPIGKNFINHISQISDEIFYKNHVDCEETLYIKERKLFLFYCQQVRDSYELFRDYDHGSVIINTTEIGTLSPKSLTEHLRDLLIKLIKDDNKFYTITKNII